MDINNNNVFSEAFPPHPHRRIKILISILAICLIIGSVLIYKSRIVNNVDNKNNKVQTKEEKTAALNKELAKLSKAMVEANSGQKALTPTELKAIANSLKNTKK